MAVMAVLQYTAAFLALVAPFWMPYDQVLNLFSKEILNNREELWWGDDLKMRMNSDFDGARDWCAGINGQGQICFAMLQEDENLLIYNRRRKRLPTGNTPSVERSYFLLYENDRNAISTNSTAPIEEAEGRIKSVVGVPQESNNTLYTGQTFRHPIMANCNLALVYSENKWSGGQTKLTNRRGRDCYAALEADGNLVIYGDSNTRLWATDIQWGEGTYILTLKKDGNMIIYGEGRWSTDSFKQWMEQAEPYNTTGLI